MAHKEITVAALPRGSSSNRRRVRWHGEAKPRGKQSHPELKLVRGGDYAAFQPLNDAALDLIEFRVSQHTHMPDCDLDSPERLQEPRNGFSIGQFVNREGPHHRFGPLTCARHDTESIPAGRTVLLHRFQGEHKPCAGVDHDRHDRRPKGKQVLLAPAFLSSEFPGQLTALRDDLLACQKPSTANRRHRAHSLHPGSCSLPAERIQDGRHPLPVRQRAKQQRHRQRVSYRQHHRMSLQLAPHGAKRAPILARAA